METARLSANGFACDTALGAIAMNERLEELITRFPLFEGYQPFGARRLIERGEVRSLIAGDLLYREGDPASSVALVLIGDLEVFVDRGGRSMTLTHAGPGSILGEIGVLCGIDRTASVRAAEPT